eukprot:294307_1
MGNFYTLNSMVILMFTEITSIRSYKVIYSFSWLGSGVLINTRNQMAQYPIKMSQNIILWVHQHHLKIEKTITFISNSKIDHEYRNNNCTANFILSSYGVVMPLYTPENETNKKINMKYCCFYYVYIFFSLVSSIVFGQKLCCLQNLIENIMR